jgi:hypothetical protein
MVSPAEQPPHKDSTEDDVMQPVSEEDKGFTTDEEIYSDEEALNIEDVPEAIMTEVNDDGFNEDQLEITESDTPSDIQRKTLMKKYHSYKHRTVTRSGQLKSNKAVSKIKGSDGGIIKGRGGAMKASSTFSRNH